MMTPQMGPQVPLLPGPPPTNQGTTTTTYWDGRTYGQVQRHSDGSAEGWNTKGERFNVIPDGFGGSVIIGTPPSGEGE